MDAEQLRQLVEESGRPWHIVDHIVPSEVGQQPFHVVLHEWVEPTEEERRLIRDVIQVEVARIRSARLRRILSDSGVPERFRHFTLDDFRTKGGKPLAGKEAALQACEAWLDGEIRFLTLYGEVGVGKTALGTATFLEFVRRTGLAGVWRNFVDYTLELQRAFRGEGVDAATLQRTVLQAPVLFLDDLATTALTSWKAEVLYQLVNGRYQAQLPTIFTTNVPPKKLAQEVGVRVVDRLGERGFGMIVEVGGVNFRRRKGRK